MAKLQNEKLKGKVINFMSEQITFDAQGIAEVSDETQSILSQLNGYSIPKRTRRTKEEIEAEEKEKADAKAKSDKEDGVDQEPQKTVDEMKSEMKANLLKPFIAATEPVKTDSDTAWKQPIKTEAVVDEVKEVKPATPAKKTTKKTK